MNIERTKFGIFFLFLIWKNRICAVQTVIRKSDLGHFSLQCELSLWKPWLTLSDSGKAVNDTLLVCWPEENWPRDWAWFLLMDFGFFATVAFELLSWGNSILSNVINLIAFNNVLFCSQNTAQKSTWFCCFTDAVMRHRLFHTFILLTYTFINGLHSSYVNRACFFCFVF